MTSTEAENILLIIKIILFIIAIIHLIIISKWGAKISKKIKEENFVDKDDIDRYSIIAGIFGSGIFALLSFYETKKSIARCLDKDEAKTIKRRMNWRFFITLFVFYAIFKGMFSIITDSLAKNISHEQISTPLKYSTILPAPSLTDITTPDQTMSFKSVCNNGKFDTENMNSEGIDILFTSYSCVEGLAIWIYDYNFSTSGFNLDTGLDGMVSYTRKNLDSPSEVEDITIVGRSGRYFTGYFEGVKRNFYMSMFDYGGKPRGFSLAIDSSLGQDKIDEVVRSVKFLKQ